MLRAQRLTFFNSLEEKLAVAANGHLMSVRAAAYHLAGRPLPQ
jgi:hypothetical protein